MQQPAQLRSDSAISPRRSSQHAAFALAEPALVPFVVETLGVSDPPSFKMLAPTIGDLAEAGRRAVTRC